MLLSFSVDYMRPYVEWGFRQYKGEDVRPQRVKRQTIRARGPRATRLLEYKRPDMPLHLWWKSRTKDREFIGAVAKWTVDPIHIRNADGAVVSFGETPIDFEQCAFNDGFDSLADFKKYFVPNVGDEFDGVIYKW